MTTMSHSQDSKRIYRVDKFMVPDRSRAEFVEKVRETHEILRTLPGFEEDSILEKTDGPGEFNMVTIVVWRDADAIAAARETMKARQQEAGFDPGETMKRLGIQADLVNYRQIEA